MRRLAQSIAVRCGAAALAAVLAAVLASGGAFAQDAYPSKTVKLMVGAAPGGNPDVLARMLGQKLSESLGKPFVIESVPGAGGVTAAPAVLRPSS